MKKLIRKLIVPIVGTILVSCGNSNVESNIEFPQATTINKSRAINQSEIDSIKNSVHNLSWAYYMDLNEQRWYISSKSNNKSDIYSLMPIKNSMAGWGTVGTNVAFMNIYNDNVKIDYILDNIDCRYYDVGWGENVKDCLIQQDIEKIRNSTVDIKWWFFQAPNKSWYITTENYTTVLKFALSDDGKEYDWKKVDIGIKPTFFVENGIKKLKFINNDIPSPKLNSMSPPNVKVGAIDTHFTLSGDNLKKVKVVFIGGIELTFKQYGDEVDIFATKVYAGSIEPNVAFGFRDVIVKFEDDTKITLPNGLMVEEISTEPNFESDAYRSSYNVFWVAGLAPKRFFDYNIGQSSDLSPCLKGRKKGTEALGNCTWYAQGRLLELGYNKETVKKFYTSAKGWDETARSNSSMIINTTPLVGAVAQHNRGDWGHVAIVEKVNSDGTIDISESSYAPCSDNWNFEYRIRNVPNNEFDNYIHLTK